MVSVMLALLGRVKPMTLALGGIVAILLVMVATLSIQKLRLEKELAESFIGKVDLESQLVINHFQVDELLAAISEQSREVQRLDADTERLKTDAIVAQSKVEKQRLRYLAEISDLIHTKGESCKDGIMLVDSELGL